MLLLYILIQLPPVQNFIKNKITAYVEGKIKTRFTIGKLKLKLFKSIELQQIYLEDQKKDTLLFAEKALVELSMFQLIHSYADIHKIELDNAKIHLTRLQPDTVFNFQYIINAFADTTTPTKPSEPTKFDIRIDNIALKNTQFKYHDDVTGNEVFAGLGSVETGIDRFDVVKMNFNIPSINIGNVIANVRQYKPSVQLKQIIAAPDTTSFSLSLSIGQTAIQNIQFHYHDEVGKMLISAALDNFKMQSFVSDLGKLDFKIKSAALNNSDTKIVFEKNTAAKNITPATVDTSASNWKILIDNLSVNKTDFAFDDNNAPKITSGMDYSHLAIKNFLAEGSHFNLNPKEYKGEIAQASFSEKSGLNLKKLQAQFVYNDSGAVVKKLLLQTDKTLLKDSLAVHYPSIAAATKQPGDVFIAAHLPNNTIAVRDVLLVAPMLHTYLGAYTDNIIKLNTTLKGFVKDLSIPIFEFSGLGNTYAKISGKMSGLPDANKAYFDLKIDKFYTTAKDIKNFVPKGAIPEDKMRLPASISASGYFKGGISDVNTKMSISTPNGNADIFANIQHSGVFNTNITLNNLDLGYLAKQDSTLGKITMHGTASGNGLNINKFNLNRLQTQFDLVVNAAEIYGYNYQNFTTKGNLQNGLLNATAAIQDPNISLNLTATSDLKPAFPSIKMNLVLDTISMNGLHLMKDTLGFSAVANADFTSTNPDSLNGYLTVSNFQLNHLSDKYVVDSISLIAQTSPEAKHISLNADSSIVLNFDGQYKLTEMATALQHTINKYYRIPHFKDTLFTPQNWTLNGWAVPKQTLLQFAPSLKGTDSLLLKTNYNSADSSLYLSLKDKAISYGTQKLNGFNTEIKTENDSLKITSAFQSIQSPAYKLYKTGFRGSMANNNFAFGAGTTDSLGKPCYGIGGIATALDSGFRLSLKPQGFLLNYERWNVSSDNYLQYDSTGFRAHNFALNSRDQFITLNSSSPLPNSPLDVQFKNFKIATLTQLANQANYPIDGIINGNIELRDLLTQLHFTSDVHVDSIQYAKQSIGNIAAKVVNEQDGIYTVDASFYGNQNDVRLSGNYYQANNAMDLVLDAKQLNLAIAKPFSTGQLNDIGGFMVAKMNIKGPIDTPSISGTMRFDSAFITPYLTGERLTLSNKEIKISPQGIHFDKFTLRDSKNNRLTTDGDIITSDFLRYAFNLKIKARDFNVVNAPKADGRFFYGKLAMNADLTIGGNMDSPKMNGTLRVNKATDFSLIMPSDDPEVEDRKGVVVLKDGKRPLDSTRIKTLRDSLTRNSQVKGMDILLNLESDSAAKFALIIDERTGDALTMSGSANLAFGIDKSGKMSLTGAYALSNGSYQLSLSIMKKKFTIQSGSTITWTGDPLSANVNITANYLVRTAPIDLLQQQLSGTDLTIYNQPLPFTVKLMLKKDLMKPEISFDITVPDDDLSIFPSNGDQITYKLQALRNDQSELNKQVFALLLIGRFVGDNPLQSAGDAANVGDMARQSASRILSDQLNKLAATLIKGVDLSFDLQSGTDYTSGSAQSRTDLNVGMSKKLFSNRLRISVGNDFALEGTNSNQQAVNIAGDVKADYLLSEDGRYILRAYRKNKYEGVIEGQVVRTGLGFILSFDYDKFKELFQKKKIDRKKLKRYKQEQKKEEQQQKEDAQAIEEKN